MKIVIPIPQKVSLNSLFSRMHWRKRKELVDLYLMSLIEFRKAPPITKYPVEISYYFSFRGKWLDSTNCAAMAKMLEDSLVKWGILKTDSPESVAGTHLYSRKGPSDEVEIIIN